MHHKHLSAERSLARAGTPLAVGVNGLKSEETGNVHGDVAVTFLHKPLAFTSHYVL